MGIFNVLSLELILCAILVSEEIEAHSIIQPFFLVSEWNPWSINTKEFIFFNKNYLKCCLQKMWKIGFWTSSPFFSICTFHRFSFSILRATLCNVVIKCKEFFFFKFFGFLYQNVHFCGCKILFHQVSRIQSIQVFQW